MAKPNLTPGDTSHLPIWSKTVTGHAPATAQLQAGLSQEEGFP